jgi:Fe-S oxidoreductase
MAAIRELRRVSGLMRCLECGKCTTLCPLSEYGEFSAARMAAIHDPRTEFTRHAKTIDRCLTCGSCEVRCPQGVRFTDFVRDVREQIPSTLRSPCPHGSVVQAAGRLMAGSNGTARDLSWIDGDLRVAERGEVALFVGCLPLFDSFFAKETGVRAIEIARAAIRLLNLAGIEPVVVPQEKCCGHDLLWNGDRETFEALAKQNVEAFRERGVKQIVTTCAECCRTWSLDYAQAVPSYKPSVEHISETLARLAASGELTFNAAAGTRVTFQDPCRLGRHLGIVDAPRALLGAMKSDVVEMEHHGIDASCCGTAGFIHCDATSRLMQKARLAEAAATGADVLITACPKCWIHFACAQHEDQLRGRDAPRIQIEDLTLFAARNAGEGGAAR